MIDNLRAFLNDFDEGINAFQLTTNIKLQEIIILKAEKEYSKSIEQMNTLNNGKVALEQKITEATNAQTQYQSSLEAEKKKLEGLKSQIK